MAKRFMKLAVVSMLCLSMGASMVACGPTTDVTTNPPTTNPSTTSPSTTQPTTTPPTTQPPVDQTGWRDPKVYTYNDYTVAVPSLWNEVSSTDGGDRDIYNYLMSAFYEFDFEYDAKGEIVPGGFTVNYAAATKLEDVTAKYKGKYGITDKMAEEGHHAFAITLRDDLAWDDGTAIHASDFVFTMEQQLSPNYLFEQAANFWNGNYVLHNARNYFYQGQTVMSPCMVSAGVQYQTVVLGEDGYYHRGTADGEVIRVKVTVGSDWSSDPLLAYANAGYLGDAGKTLINALAEEVDENGSVPATKELVDMLDAFCKGYGGGYENEWQEFCGYYFAYPEMDFSEVGFFVGDNENELVFVIDNTLSPLNADGTLSYEAGYYLSGFPLVKKDLWQKLEDPSKKPYTNKYNSVSVENSASWGPYKLSNYQAATTYTLSRNDNWYGYKTNQYDGQYQTDQIVVRQIAEWNTAWQAFQNGELCGIGIDVTIADDYRNSSRAYYTPTSGVSQYFFQCNEGALTKEKGNAMLKYLDFRKALSLGLDRSAWCTELTTSYLPYLGIYNDLIYYDVANGGAYRQTQVAKEALLSTYGATKDADGNWTVGRVTYDDIDEAVDALTGYNLTLARDLLKKAYADAVAAGDYAEGDTVTLRYGVSAVNANTERQVAFMNRTWATLAEGTPFEGKINVVIYEFNSANWIDDFRVNGMYDIANAYISGGAWNPYYSLQIFLLDGQRLTLGWNTAGTTDDVMLELTVPGGEGQETITDRMNLVDWFNCLNGLDGAKYNFALYPAESRLLICAKLEQKILESYTSLPIASMYSSSLMSYKCDYITYEYNTFMSYGGIQYMTYNYDDTAWADYVKTQGGTLNYKN